MDEVKKQIGALVGMVAGRKHMKTAREGDSITFAVDVVEPGREALPQMPMHAYVAEMVGSEIQSCSDYHTKVCAQMGYHPLLAAVYTAYSLHRPLVLSPDAVWLTITQGVAHHMVTEGERLRDRFVSHQGRLRLTVECGGWVWGSPENPWGEAFAGWTGQIRTHVGAETHDALVCDFSTTTPQWLAASHVTMMDIFEKYFEYVAMAICGLPEVTLRGTPEDWRRIREKAQVLEKFDMGWWLAHLRPILEQFERASRGDVDIEHWRSICKLRMEYGGHVINGWVAKLFPYLRAYYNGPCALRNPIFETGEGFQTFNAPSGLSQVPFVWSDARTGEKRQMEAIGGLVGVRQDETTLALEPMGGWAVRERLAGETLLERLKAAHEVTHTTVKRLEISAQLEEDWEKRFTAEARMKNALPGVMKAFYHAYDQARLFVEGEKCLVRFVRFEEIKPFEWGEIPGKFMLRGPTDKTWYRLAQLECGEWLAMNLDREMRSMEWKNEWGEPMAGEGLLCVVCVVSEATQGKAGENPVVALSVDELFERLLGESEAGMPYWKKEGFVGYGDAMAFTRMGDLDEEAGMKPVGRKEWRRRKKAKKKEQG